MIARSRIIATLAAGAALVAALPATAAGSPPTATPATQDDGSVSSGLSGYAIGLGAAALGVLAIVLASGGDSDSTDPNSP